MTVLLIVIYLVFISLGLPDQLFGVACLVGMISFSEIAANRISTKKSFINGIRILGIAISGFGILYLII